MRIRSDRSGLIRLFIELADCHEPRVYRAKGLDCFWIGCLSAFNPAGLIEAIEATELAAIMRFNIKRAMLDARVRTLHMRLLLEES